MFKLTVGIRTIPDGDGTKNYTVDHLYCISDGQKRTYQTLIPEAAEYLMNLLNGAGELEEELAEKEDRIVELSQEICNLEGQISDLELNQAV